MSATAIEQLPKLLGYDHGTYFYQVPGIDQAIGLNADWHSERNLSRLAGRERLRELYPDADSDSFNVTQAVGDLFDRQHKVGLFDRREALDRNLLYFPERVLEPYRKAGLPPSVASLNASAAYFGGPYAVGYDHYLGKHLNGDPDGGPGGPDDAVPPRTPEVIDDAKRADQSPPTPKPNDTESKPAPRYELLTAAELIRKPSPDWAIKGVLPAEGIGAIYGPPACGKSFLTLDMLGAISEGREWFGHRVYKAPVVYLALEGAGGLGQRLKAYAVRWGVPVGMRFIVGQWDVRNPDDRLAIVEAVRAAGMAGGVLTIDTLARAAPGVDENLSRDMGEIITGLTIVQAQLGGLVLAVHHAGKDASKKLRGHSSLLGALDAVVGVNRSEGGERTWIVEKAKDGADGEERGFELSIVKVGTDGDGDEETSCIVIERQMAPKAAKAKVRRPRGKNQRATLPLVLAKIKTDGELKPLGPAGALVKAVTYEAALDAAAPGIVAEPELQRKRAKEAIAGLVDGQFLNFSDNLIWAP